MNIHRASVSEARAITSARAAVLTALITAVLLAAFAGGPVAAASATFVPACDGVNIRAAASTGATIKVTLSLGHNLTVSGTVSGSSWGTSCPGWKSGSTWYTITHVDGQPVSTRFGVSLLFAATGVLTATTSSTPAPSLQPAPPTASAAPSSDPTPSPATQMIPACASVNIRTSPSTGAAIKVRLTPSDRVTVSGSLASSAWSTVCAGAKSGSTWYRVTHVNGQAVATRYGVASLYAATGVLTTASGAGATPAAAPPTPAPTAVPPTSAPAPATPAPTPGPTTAPAPAPTAAPLTGQVLAPACDGVNLRASPSTRATIKVRLGLANTITVDGTVAGSSWSTACPTAKSGSTWYRVSQVNGRPVSELYGAATIYAATGVLSDSVTAATPGVTTLGAVTTFYGRGYGHGVGMSQYGARGRALAGQTAAQILAHYYANTTLGSIAADTAIRVLVLDDFTPTAAAPLVIYGRSGPWTVSGVDLEFPADARLRLFPPASATTGSWRLLVESAAGQVLFDGPTSAAIRVRGTSDATLIQLYSKPSAYDHYRGALQVLPTGASVDVVNQLPLETYLRGVVPAEMPSSWPLEARIAQTIAARSFAAYQLRPTTGTFDVYDDTRDQVYGGVRRETAEADAVVAATTGQVLRSGSSIVNALFHSTGGGGTENNEDVFVSSTGGRVAGPVTYLRGSSDRDPAGVPYDTGAPYATWQTRAYTTAELSAIFAADSRTNVGTLTALDLRNRGVSGRLVSVTLVGSSGTKMVSGAVFIAVFNANRLAADGPLRSTLFDVAPIP